MAAARGIVCVGRLRPDGTQGHVFGDVDNCVTASKRMDA